MSDPSAPINQPPNRSGPTLSPTVTIAIAVIAAVLASVITTIVLDGGRQSAPSSTTQVSEASAKPNSSSVTRSSSAAPSAVDGTAADTPVPGTAAAAAAKVAPAVVLVTSSGGWGSGFIVSADGWILTNQHVVEKDKRVTVTLADGREVTGTVTAIDTLTDLALIRVKATGLTAAELGNSGDLSVGQPVVAIGNPLGLFANTVTSGVVSGLSRSEFLDDSGVYRNLVQTDAAINAGNSGGPLADLSGRVVGINSLGIADELATQGLFFAIPIDVARPIINQAIAGQPLTRPFLGVRYVAVDEGVQQREKLTIDHGVLLKKQLGDSGEVRPAVEPGSPAAKAGLREGDVIVGIEDQAIDFKHPLEIVVVQFEAGDTVTLHIVRDGQERDITVKLGKRR
jgi:S1-C subfamily serine protease